MQRFLLVTARNNLFRIRIKNNKLTKIRYQTFLYFAMHFLPPKSCCLRGHLENYFGSMFKDSFTRLGTKSRVRINVSSNHFLHLKFRSREKRRLNDMLLEKRVVAISRDNHILRAQIAAVVKRTGIRPETLIGK